MRFLKLSNDTEKQEEKLPVLEIPVEHHGESVSENMKNDSNFLGFEMENQDEQPVVLNRADGRTYSGSIARTTKTL